MKFKVALRNLYISQAIIIIFLIFAYIFWFPYSFSQLGGFYRTAWMIIFVDIVLGPFLVFFIYKENKKYLKFDINVLLSIQLIAFVFGAYSLFLKHPAYAVFSIDRFVLTNVSNIFPKPSIPKLIDKHFFSSTKLVVASFPENNNERDKLNFSILFNGSPDIDNRPKYFSPLERHIGLIMKKSINLEQLVMNQQEKKIYSKFLSENNSSNFSYFPLVGNNQKDMIWVFDKKDGKPIEILDIDPWNLKISSK